MKYKASSVGSHSLSACCNEYLLHCNRNWEMGKTVGLTAPGRELMYWSPIKRCASSTWLRGTSEGLSVNTANSAPDICKLRDQIMPSNDIFFLPCMQVTYRKQNRISTDFHRELAVDLRCYWAGLGFNCTLSPQSQWNYDAVSTHTNIRVQFEYNCLTCLLTSGMQHRGRKLTAIHAMNLAPTSSTLLYYSNVHGNMKILYINSCQCKHTALLRSRSPIKAGSVKLHTVAT